MNFGVFKQQKVSSSASFAILISPPKTGNVYVLHPKVWVSVWRQLLAHTRVTTHCSFQEYPDHLSATEQLLHCQTSTSLLCCSAQSPGLGLGRNAVCLARLLVLETRDQLTRASAQPSLRLACSSLCLRTKLEKGQCLQIFFCAFQIIF